MVAPSQSSGYVPDRGDIVWLQLDPQAGHAQAGHRPALVVSPRAYNGKVGLALFCPITSTQKGYPFEVSLPDEGAATGVILADQLRSLDWRARRAKKFDQASGEIVAGVLGRIKLLVEG